MAKNAKTVIRGKAGNIFAISKQVAISEQVAIFRRFCFYYFARFILAIRAVSCTARKTFVQ